MITDALIASRLVKPLREMGLYFTVTTWWNPETAGSTPKHNGWGTPVICVLMPDDGFSAEQMGVLKKIDRSAHAILRGALDEFDARVLNRPGLKYLSEVVKQSKPSARERKPRCRTKTRRSKIGTSSK